MLQTGIKAGHTVSIGGFLASNGSIDLNNANVAGTFLIVEGGAGLVLNGGEVSANAVIQLGNSDPFSGTATFASIAQFGDLEVAGTHLEGTFRITGNVAGSVGIRGGDLKSTGKIQIDGSLTSTGDVSVEKGDGGVFGNALGDILVAGAVAGDIHVDTDVEGDIDLDSTMSGTISIDESLNSTGRILIDGLCSGPITIEEQTVANSLIYLSAGLDSGGSITINAGAGGFAANGNIRVGPVSTTPPLDSVTFDGSIMIVDGPSSGGDLNGTIQVVGCHATSDDLDICICGNNNGSVSIVQTSCSNQVGWSCVSGCP